MKELTDLITNPVVWKVIIAYWVASAVIGAMPTPTTSSAQWYVFLFRFGHILGGNLNRAAVKFGVPTTPEQPPQP